MTPIAEPFCDNLRLTFPFPNSGCGLPGIVSSLLVRLDDLGLSPRPDGKSWDVGAYGGVVFAAKQFSVFAMQFSGGALRTIREAGLLREIVECVADHPYTVTRLDASCDYAIPAPEYLSRLYYRIRRGSIVLGRKVVTFRDVESHTLVNAQGQTVRNLYLGKRNGEVRVLIYDKRHERLCKGFPDLGDMVRVEVRLKSQVGCTVWDALSPERVYYHYAAPALVDLPESVRPWKANGQGFEVLHKQSNFTTYERMKMLVEEAAAIKQLLRLVAIPDSGGIVALTNLLLHRIKAV